MASKNPHVVNASQQLEIDAPAGPQTLLVPADARRLSLSDLLRKQDLPLNTRCGQRGLCDGCLIELLSGSLIHRSSGAAVHANGQVHTLRGCEYHLADEPLTRIRIPARSVLAYQPQVVTQFRLNVPRAHDPLFQLLSLPAALPEPTPAALLAAVKQLSPSHAPLTLADTIAAQLKTLVPSLPLLVSLEYRPQGWMISHLAPQPPAGHPDHTPLGVAIDIGTTTIALLLVDLTNGQVLSQAAGFNRQMHLGDDVLTRINLCTTDKANIQTLQQAVIAKTINPLLTEAADKAALSPQRIACYSLAGNTTMLHLLAGVDPTSLGFAPFTPVFLEHRTLPSKSLHLHPVMHHATAADADLPVSNPTAHLLAGAAAYVGADITAGVFSSGLVYDEGPSLLVDVGTNGEIVLKHQHKMLGCATAAGPAFEGAGLTSGMRAGQGAISHIRFTTNPFAINIEIIEPGGKTKPAGICGSAYVDFLAEARRIGLLSTTGRFDLSAVPDAQPHLVDAESGKGLRIAQGQGRHDILITEQDIAKLLQAKGAIAAGILTLLARSGLSAADIKTLYLAGGFGMHMHLPSALGCGLLPGFALNQIQLVGNTSLAGAYLALLDSGAAAELERIGKAIDIVELNLDPEFEFRYIDQLSLPD